MSSHPFRSMPDIAADARTDASGKLEWVGMDEITVPVLVTGGEGIDVRVPARVTAFVDLPHAAARGIHMSRLYLHVDRTLTAATLTPATLRHTLRAFLDSHPDLSTRALLRIRFEHLVRRRALASDNSGWKAYPVTLTAHLDGAHFALELGVSVQYASTCPASAALARQLIQEQFRHDFDATQPLDHARVLAWLGSEQGIVATPHAQRSTADIRVRLAPAFGQLPIVELIDRIENALQTVVQTAVKREDEQAFARLNGANLMFCEDAARRIQAALADDARFADFWIRAAHHESLHPHDAVAYAVKGIEAGYAGLD
jgi:GTP cyclohydrolase I